MDEADSGSGSGGSPCCCPGVPATLSLTITSVPLDKTQRDRVEHRAHLLACEIRRLGAAEAWAREVAFWNAFLRGTNPHFQDNR